MATERLCVFCAHWSLDPGEPGYSDCTPGWSASVACRKGVYDKRMIEFDGEESFREVISQANQCHFYAQVETGRE